MLFFDIAAYWHRVYALYIEAVLQYGGAAMDTADLLHDAHTCYQGNWIEGSGSRYTDFSEFLELKQCHDSFHKLADQAMHELAENRGNPIWLAQTAERLRSNSFSVINAIARLDSVVKSESPSVTVTSAEECPIKKHKTGVQVIDDQHEALAVLARRLMENSAEKFSNRENAELVSELAALTALHFDTEEIYMQCIQLPPLEMERHKAEHRRILGRLFAISTHVEDLDQIKTSEVMPQFVRWFSDHLIDYDYTLKRF